MNTEHTQHPCETVDASADVMKLAEMILSDCGCSTAISDRLQRRVAGRIQLYVDSALGSQQQAEPVQLKVAANNWPKQCPITRRDFFMEIDGVPTYGGPYDSYTIPEMTGQPDQPWHERELFVRRYDHDFGSWVEDEFIPLRVIHEDVLMELEDAAEAAKAEPAAPAVKESLTADQQAEPVSWVRFCSDGCYEGPLMNSSPAMDGARRTSGAWTPLFAAQPVARDVLMAVAKSVEYVRISGGYAALNGAQLSQIVDAHTAQSPAGAGAAPDGYALVPIKPTDSMLDAAVSAGDEPGGDYYTIYAAMLAAAPQATAEDPSVVGDAVAVPTIKLGLYGRAFDIPQTRRAYTYQHQPDNLDAYKLGRAAASTSPGGDSIDHGLSLLKELQAHGFGVFELGDQQKGGAG